MGGGLCLIKGPRTESCEENSECFWENSKKTRQWVCDLSFFENTELLLDYVLMPFPGVVDGVFISDYPLQVAIVICLHACMENQVLPLAACPSHEAFSCDWILYSS